MKNKIVIILSKLLVLASCNFGDTSQLDKCLKATIKENNCFIALTAEEVADIKSVKLKTQCINDSALFYGKVMYDFLMNTNTENLYFDRYLIFSSSDQEILSFDKIESMIILEKKKLFDKLISDIKNKSFKNVYQLFSYEIKNESNFEEFVSQIEPLIVKGYKTFEGFTIVSEAGQKYLSFAMSNNGNNRIIITFLMDFSKDDIYGYSIE